MVNVEFQAKRYYKLRNGTLVYLTSTFNPEYPNSPYVVRGRVKELDGKFKDMSWDPTGTFHIGNVSLLDLDGTELDQESIPDNYATEEAAESAREEKYPSDDEGCTPKECPLMCVTTTPLPESDLSNEFATVVAKGDKLVIPGAPAQRDLQAFMWMLLRDHVPFGAVEKAVKELQGCRDRGVTKINYDDKNLENYCLDLSQKILGVNQ